MAKFRIGDVCVGVGLTNSTDRNGMECVIKSELSWREIRACRVTGDLLPAAYAHWVEWADGLRGWVRPVRLRLRRPPSWDRWIYDTSDVDQPVAHNEERKIVSHLKGEVGA